MKKSTTILFLFLALPLTARNQLTYNSMQVKAACEKVGLTKLLPTSVENADTIVTTAGRSLSVRISHGKVEHIGCHLFSNEQRTMCPSPVYDYLEFACLDQLLGVSENPFVYKNLVIDGGTWNDVLAIAETSACTVTRLDNVAYKVDWAKNDTAKLTVTFPIGYEKLYMMSRSEIEKKFISELCSAKAVQQEDMADPDTTLLKATSNDVLVLEGEHYIIADVNQNLYYKQSDDKGLVLIWDKQHPAESVANMFISHDKWLTGHPIKLRITTHERKTEEVLVTVRQLLAYAHETGCEAYWGLESLTETELKGTLFLYNPAYGFDHVLKVSCDPRLAGTNDFELTSLVALFSPTTNIHNLFATSKGKSNPKKIESK